MAGRRDGGRCYALAADGVVLAIRLTTRAGRDGIDGIGATADGSEVAHLRVRAAPREGAANAAAIRLLAKTLKVPKSNIALAAGTTSRLKRVKIEGDATALARAIDAWPRL